MYWQGQNNVLTNLVRPVKIGAAPKPDRGEAPEEATVHREKAALPLERPLAGAVPESAAAPTEAQSPDRLALALSMMPSVGTEFLGFHLLAELGRGASGRVYLARQGDLAGRHVALKVSADIFNEAHALAQLQHTNVVPIYSVHRTRPLYAVCMPYLGSTTLADVLRDLHGRKAVPHSGKALVSTLHDLKHSTLVPHAGGQPESQTVANTATATKPAVPTAALESPPPPVGGTSTSILEMLKKLDYVEAVLWIATRLAEGLAHAHDHGILHLDLKPANILLTDEGQPMLLDFNMAHDTKALPGDVPDLIGGTLPYMSPEHLGAFSRDARDVDERSDLYSLGVILYELLTGRVPFPTYSAPTKALLERMIAERQHAPWVRCWNKAVSPAVESIVRHCLAPDPRRRYQSAREVLSDLQRHLRDLPLAYAREPSWGERTGKWTRRHPSLVTSLIVAVLGAVLLAGAIGGAIKRSQNEARLEAANGLSLFEEDLKTVQFLLTARTADPQRLRKGIAQAGPLLDRYRVLDDPRWHELPHVRNLSEADRQRLRQDMGELLSLLAQGLYLQAVQDPMDSHAMDWVHSALQLNQRAEVCYSPHQGPRMLWTQRAELTGLMGDQDGARQLQTQAATIPLRTGRDYYLVGADLSSRSEYRDALPFLEEATRRDPQYFWASFVQGLCHDVLAQDAEALACYRASISLWPRFPWTYVNRGAIYLRQRDYARACADFDQALTLDPHLSSAYVHRAFARLKQGNFGAVVRDLRRAWQLGDSSGRQEGRSIGAR